MLVRTLMTVGILAAMSFGQGFGQSVLSVSSASAAPGGQATVQISLNTAYPGNSEGLQWTLNAPSGSVTSYTTTAGPAAIAANKSLSCANNTCLLTAMNSTSFASGVVASVTLNLSSSASGNLSIQLSNPVEALLNGEGGSISTTNGVVSVGVSVAVSPASASLYASKSQQFSATVNGTTNTSVTWTLNPAIGTLTSAGLYTAPSSISSTQNVTVTATSAADPTQSASATVTLVPPVSISLSPGSVSLEPAQTQQFTATVANSSNATVAWSLSPPVGSISNGLYTAPPSISTAQTVMVVATSAADPTQSASSIVSLVPPVSVTVTPSSISLGASQTQTFTAAVANATNTGVSWSISPALGVISSAGVYTAPSTIMSPQSITVMATSVADPTKIGSAAISLVPPVSISVSPASVTLAASQVQQFTATVNNSTNTGVTWTLSPAVGTISNGLYTAPSNITSVQTVTVAATSAADPTKSASAVVSLLPPVSVSLTPTSVSLTTSQTQLFSAAVSNATNTGVSWALSPAVGSIVNGLYTAPASISSPVSVTIIATSIADPTKSATGVITLVAPIFISVTPTSASLGPSQSQQLNAIVVNTTNTGVAWSLNPVIGSLSDGLYTAPAGVTSPQSVTITATSMADPTKSAAASITVLPPVSVSLNPTIAYLQAGGAQQFSASMANSTNPNVTWSMSPSAGTLSSSGLYTAPLLVGSFETVTITATSVADPTQSASAQVILIPSSGVIVSPSNVSLLPSQKVEFKAKTSSGKTQINWTIVPIVNGTAGTYSPTLHGAISSNGQYVAPSQIISQTTVIVEAISAANPTIWGVAVVTLLP